MKLRPAKGCLRVSTSHMMMPNEKNAEGLLGVFFSPRMTSGAAHQPTNQPISDKNKSAWEFVVMVCE